MRERGENRCIRRISEIVCEDKISGLPDDLLLKILRLLPTKEAVATTILSKRWRFVWRMLPVLVYKEDNVDDYFYNFDYDYGDGDGDGDERKKSVWWFLNQSMELHRAPKLTVLSIELGRGCPTDANFDKWVTKAVDLNVIMLKFKLCWSANPARLPNSLYNCKSLVNLSLSEKVFVDSPSSSCLPSLLLLKLHFVVYEDEASLVRFLSSCPVLDALWVKRNKYDNVRTFTVNVPTLTILVYENYTSLEDDNDEVDNDMGLVVDTPTLKSFSITDYLGHPWSIQNMPCLEYVWLDVGQPYPNIGKMLRQFSSVLSLDINLTDELVLCFSNIKFSQLTECKIYPCDSYWMDSLVSFLQNTLKLKSLTIDYSSTARPPNTSSSWMEMGLYPNDPPICLVSSLETFEVIEYGKREDEEEEEGYDEERELVEYILSYSRCLKTAKIFLASTLKLETRDKIIVELKAIPRDSITSLRFFQTET